MSNIAKEQKSVSDIEVLIDGRIKLETLDCLALACYVWSSSLIEPLIKRCREAGFKGKVILGGYQIHHDSCKQLYPSGDFYIPGYAEVALPKAILDESSISSRIIDEPIEAEKLPSPYIDGSLPLELGQAMIHWETRRGCAFKCTFCAHKDLIEVKNNRVKLLSMEKIGRELDVFKEKEVKKINILDPIFNLEPNHIDILKYAIAINLTALLSLQVRFESVTENFLILCSKLNVHLEFGLQTTNKEESIAIKRGNNMTKVDATIKLLNQWGQSFEVSLIYGLPEQTVASFKGSIDYLRERNVRKIKAFPLMLLEGTELHKSQGKHNIIEGIIDESGIPHVVACNSFTRDEWGIMHNYAGQLASYDRAA